MTATPTALAAPGTLWRVAVPPLIWLAHFTLVYATVSTACGRWSGAGVPRGPIAVYTAVALLLLALCVTAPRRGRAVLDPIDPLDDDHPGDRADFVATTTALLAVAAALAVIAVGAATWLVPACR